MCKDYLPRLRLSKASIASPDQHLQSHQPQGQEPCRRPLANEAVVRCGELTGPSRGPSTKPDIALALLSGVVTSAMVPPPIVTGAEPAAPAKKRQAKNPPRFGAAAQPIFIARKHRLQIL